MEANQILEQMKKQLNELIQNDKVVLKALDEDSTITFDEAFNAVEKVSDYATQVMKEWITIENMPNQTMYWHVLQDTVKRVIEETNDMTYAICQKVQKQSDDKANIHIAIKKPEVDEARIKSFLNKLMQFGGNQDE